MQRQRATFIFTYGTLMSTVDCAVGRRERAAMALAATLVGPGSVHGRLFDAGLYPAATLDVSTDRRIHGQLWRLPKDHAALLALLDTYEGCGPGSPLPQPYRRAKVVVRATMLNHINAWMYVWVRPVADLKELPSGRWQPPGETTARPSYPIPSEISPIGSAQSRSAAT